jgi:hypothetical protein
MERREGWRTAYRLSRRYLAGSDVYDSDRLLRLVAWFEAIPIHQAGTGVSLAALSKLRKAVRVLPEFVATTGVERDRLGEVLLELRRLSLKQRLSRAIVRLRAAHGGLALPDETEVDCHLAGEMRNIVAHGGDGAGYGDFDRFLRAIYALELVCLLSMFDGIKTEAGRLTDGAHALQTYRIAIGAARREKNRAVAEGAADE